ncbi:Aliphatic sulfonates import ATP-binding protein SsuB, partial [Haemophilus influenzae]
RLKLIKQHYRR